MKHLVTLVVGILLLSLAFAAFSQPPQQITEKASNTEADVKAIKEWIKRYCATVTAGDFNAYRSFWTEDVVWLPPHGPTLQGIEACMEHNRPYFEQYDSVEKMSVEEIETGDPFAFVRFNYTCRGRPKAEGEPPKLLYLDLNRDLQKDESATTTPVYVKKGNWHDTMRASLEATFARVLEEDRAAEPRGFRPAIVRLTAYGQPMRLELLVAGLERLYFATLGRQTENGAAHFLSPRVFDKQGRSIELKLDGTMVEGRIDPRTARATELKIDGTTHRGFALMPGEVGFKFDGKYERLEVHVYYKRERGLPPHAAVDCRPIVARASECRRIRTALWDLVARDFRDRQSQIETELERCEGISSEYSPNWNSARNADYLAHARQRLELARKTLDFVQRMALGAGGWGQIEHGGWKSSDEPGYQEMRRLVQAAIQPLPYHDIAGTCGRDDKCRCLSCWVRKVKEERQRRIADNL